MPALFASTSYHFGGLTISSLQILIISVAVVLMTGLDFLIRKTSYGIAMRAISFDAATVPLMGVPVNRIISMTVYWCGSRGRRGYALRPSLSSDRCFDGNPCRLEGVRGCGYLEASVAFSARSLADFFSAQSK